MNKNDKLFLEKVRLKLLDITHMKDNTSDDIMKIKSEIASISTSLLFKVME